MSNLHSGYCVTWIQVTQCILADVDNSGYLSSSWNNKDLLTHVCLWTEDNGWNVI